MRRSSVDLPQPDGPMSDTNSPAWTVRSMPVRAVTLVPFAPGKIRSTPRTTTASDVSAAGATGVAGVSGVGSGAAAGAVELMRRSPVGGTG